ncbi:MAG: DUF4250 domain-containing protein [Clostridia bacterium]|nr:DUF4250 domain-containing protein [Clostridia bacterium]
MTLPQDTFILLSTINTWLRDEYDSIESLCEDKGVERIEIEKKLSQIGYVYDANLNRFV